MKRISAVVLLLLASVQPFSQDSQRPSQPDLPGDLMIDFGLNMWSEDTEKLRLDLWRSHSLGIYYNKRFRLTDKFSFYTGLGFGIDKYAFNDNFTWLSDSQGKISLDTLTGVNLTKNKLVTTYFDIPIEFRFFPTGTVHGEGLFVGVGAIGGMRVDTNTKIKYLLGESDVKEKLDHRLGVSDLRYGVQARLGFRSFHIYYKYYFNSVFDGSPDESGRSPSSSTIGINFSGF